MSYISAIAVDFGSTNSGCCRVKEFDANGNLIYANPEFLENVGTYAKDDTWFYIEPTFLERIRTSYDSIKDEDFRIESRIFPNTDRPNIVWGHEPIKRNYKQLLEKDGWISFKRFKMMLYNGASSYAGLDFPLILIIKTYLRLLKIECLTLESNRLGRKVSADEIMWGLTIPSIWTDENKEVMTSIAHEVFSETARVLSEPEGPLVYSLLAQNSQGRVEFVNGRTTLVIDMGGGTTDICLMQENMRNNDYHIEMVANTDGSAAGGNDIDKAFYTYMLRYISKGKVSDNGVSYDSLNDDELEDSLWNPFQMHIDDYLQMEENWNALKKRADFNTLQECPFEFTSAYLKWLRTDGHKQVSEYVKELLLNGCLFPKDEFISSVFLPTEKKICDKVKDVILQNLSNVNIDKIVFAGGLSCNHSINSALKSAIKEVLGETANHKLVDMSFSPLTAGGSIAAGACYMLINRDTIIRIAKKYYFYSAGGRNISIELRDSYKELGVKLGLGELNNILDDESQYETSYVREENGVRSIRYSLLYPISIKGQIVKNYINDELETRGDQTEVSIRLFSSDSIAIYANEDNPALKKEGEMEFNCKPNTRYKLEVDFNEAQINNELHYYLIELESGLIVSEGVLKNATTDK